jgi:propionyl-CoA synthetase
VAAYRETHVATKLPKTRSGKILRGVIRRIVDGEDANPPPTLDDGEAISAIRDAITRTRRGARP